MMLTFADTHNMIVYLSKSDASEGINQIIDFLNRSSIKYALTVNPNIYVSCIKQFWTSVAVKKVNDVIRLQDLVNKKKVVVTEATIRDALHLDDAEGKGFSRVETPLFKGMILEQEVAKGDADKVHGEDDNGAGVATEGVRVKKLERRNKVEVLKLRRLEKVGTAQRIDTSKDTMMDDVSNQGRMIAEMDVDADVVLEEDNDVAADVVKDVQESADDVKESALDQGRKAESQVEIYKIDLEHANKVLSMQKEELEPAEFQEVVDLVTIAKIITVVTGASDLITTASTTITATEAQVPAATLTIVPSRITSAPSRRRNGVVIRDPLETETPSTIIHSEAKSKDKGKGILVEEPKPLKKQAQI
nr:xylulose kinase-1 [Tanacetum cinerariifolium]